MSKPMADIPWGMTGRFRLRTTLFGIVVMEEEWERQVWRPLYTGHSPANWTRETEWRRAARKTMVSAP